MRRLLETVWTVLLVLPIHVHGRLDCSRSEYERCAMIADPLVREPHLVFPDNMDDIEIVCRTWNRFVDCLKFYTDNCFTEQQRRQFNKAVESPIESIHQMCMQPSYQKEYLQYAPCIKSTITERMYCNHHYNLLVDQVAQGDIISKSTLCCSHDRFKQCIQRETRRLCDRNLPNGPASRFSSQIIDKALSFLQDQCYNYIPNSGDCTSLSTDPQYISDPLTMSSSSEVYPWSTIQDVVAAPKEILPSRVMPPKASSTTTRSWLPSSTFDVVANSNAPSTTQLGPRTRPASYGRSNGWSDSTSNTVPTSSESSSWATISWQPSPTFPSTETWYPAAGNQLENEVEEPNQQGLTKPKNQAVTANQTISLLLSLLIAITFGMY